MRDGSAVADLLELAFKDEMQVIARSEDDSVRLLQMLRNSSLYGTFSFYGAQAFVWEEDKRIIGNASVQRNPLRPNTWVIGNVATHADARRRGIGRALVSAAIEHACQQRRCQHVALQVLATNLPAIKLYEQLGFRGSGVITRYWRAPLDEAFANYSRKATLFQMRDFVARLLPYNIPDALRFAEPFEESVYRLGVRWWLQNALNATAEEWNMNGGGAVRTRISFEAREHYLELLIGADTTKSVASELVSAGLQRLSQYSRKPIVASQTRLSNSAAEDALQAHGFTPRGAFLHMRLDA
jgi:ribosomal protein S18 acetylase RimI-like enzyme